MIAKIFPKMKDQVKFMRLKESLKTKMPTMTTLTNHETSFGIPHGSISAQNIAQNGWPANYLLPKFPMAIQKRLDEESRDFFSSTGRSKWRSKIIQTLFDQMCTYTWYPTSEQYNKVCSALVTKYQFLKDRTGRGYESWHEMLKNKFKKERSPLVDIEEINKVRSRFSKVKNQMISPSIQQTRDAQKKAISDDIEDLSVIQDIYQKRPRSEEAASGEDDYSIGIHLEKMRTECSKKTPNIRLLLDCMARTRNERADYMKHHSTKDILSRYPALKIPSVLVLEFESRLDANIEKNILKNLDLVAQKVINECQKRGVGVDIRTELAEAKKTHADLAHKGLSMAAAVLLLPLLFKESPRSLYLINEEPSIPNPVLCIKGRALDTECLIEIMMEGEKICEVDDITMALVVLMAIHFTFNIEYASKMRNTLKFVEKYLMCHNVETKMPPTVIKMANFLFD